METITEHNRLDNLIDLYLSGEIDKTSLAELKKLTVMSEANRNYVRERLEIWFSSGMLYQPGSDELERKFSDIERCLADKEKEQSFFRLKWKWGGWAAAVLLVLLLPLAGYLWGLKVSPGLVAGISMETALGARTKVYLPDSTLVWLNAGSKLTYASGYGVTSRQVSLQGEALFDVRHNEKLPFELHSKEVNVKVLGTRFVVSNYTDDDDVMVDLVRGKVLLEQASGKQKMYLSPNERMVLSKKTGRMQKEQIDAAMSDSWTKGRLFFDESTLGDIAKELARSYNVRIVVAPERRNDLFYGSFDMKQNTVEDVLQAIASTKQMKYRYKDGEYVLY